VTANDVTVELRPGTLKFFARLRSAGPRTYLVRECDYGGWEPGINVPDGYGSGVAWRIDWQDVEASLTNRQLAIRVLRGKPTGDPHSTDRHGWAGRHWESPLRVAIGCGDAT
jgi:hypothetical protein